MVTILGWQWFIISQLLDDVDGRRLPVLESLGILHKKDGDAACVDDVIGLRTDLGEPIAQTAVFDLAITLVVILIIIGIDQRMGLVHDCQRMHVLSQLGTTSIYRAVA